MTVERLRPKVVVAPTDSGATARRLARFRLPQWIVAFSPHHDTCQRLCFSYGVFPVRVAPDITDWKQRTQIWCQEQGIDAGVVVMTHGPSPARPGASSFVEVFRLDAPR
jgi:pyruvate kinase